MVAGLYLPTSDIDLVVLNSGAGDVVTALRALSSKLSRAGLAKNIQVSTERLSDCSCCYCTLYTAGFD